MTNTNKLIEDQSHNTIGNVQTVLNFLREFHHEHQFSKKETSMNSHIATAIMLDLVDDALSYENGKWKIGNDGTKNPIHEINWNTMRLTGRPLT